MKDFLGKWRETDGKPQQEEAVKPAAQPPPLPQQPPPLPPQQEASKPKPWGYYKKGDTLNGRYEILGLIGRGGFGAVYLARSLNTGQRLALKTFRDELFAEEKGREMFQKEALLWLNLGNHPHIVVARLVEHHAGRLYVGMDYVAPDAERRVSLSDHIAKAGGPLPLEQALRWAVQFCLGMEHAQAHGIICHRDIKPANILVTNGGKTLKISDFGLAAAIEEAWTPGSEDESPDVGATEGDFGMTIVKAGAKACCGTPGYMGPEVCRGDGADIRSDIYSFGLVIWQMLTGSRAPLFASPHRRTMQEFMRETYRNQMASIVPGVEEPFTQLIKNCVHPDPAARYGNFDALRADLEGIMAHYQWEAVPVPEAAEETAAAWTTRAGSLTSLGRYDEALECCDRALMLDPEPAGAWHNKGTTLAGLNRREEAVACFDQALARDSGNAVTWNGKGLSLAELGRREEALECYGHALAINPRLALVFYNKGRVLTAMGRREEAIESYDQALAIDPRPPDTWNNKGLLLVALGRHEEGIACYDQALASDPRLARAWNNKGLALVALKRHKEALAHYDQALAIDPQSAITWYNKAVMFAALGRHAETVECYDRMLGLDPGSATAWNNKGLALAALDKREEAIASYDQALTINPQMAASWHNKALVLAALGRREEAVVCYDYALTIDPRRADSWHYKGSSLAVLKRQEEALGCFDQALAINPNQVKSWNDRGVVAAALGRYEEALECYSRGMQIEPRGVDTWYNKALSEEKLGRNSEAAASYRQFVELAPPRLAQHIARARQRIIELQQQG